MKYYNAGYYLIKKKPIDFGTNKNNIVSTCSGCINTTIFDYWCLSWTKEQLDDNEKLDIGLKDEEVIKIKKWTDDKFENGEIKWGNVFPNMKIAITFKELFFKDRKDIGIYVLYFSQIDADLLLKEFEKGKNVDIFNCNDGEFGLRDNLRKKIDEKDSNSELFLGYDFIGVECDGSFHSFYCHDLTNDLNEKFGLVVNQNGLFDKIKEPEKIRDYLNDKKTGLEPVPWYIVKVKQIIKPAANKSNSCTTPKKSK